VAFCHAAGADTGLDGHDHLAGGCSHWATGNMILGNIVKNFPHFSLITSLSK
jgi:hypothetical protein